MEPIVKHSQFETWTPGKKAEATTTKKCLECNEMSENGGQSLVMRAQEISDQTHQYLGYTEGIFFSMGVCGSWLG